MRMFGLAAIELSYPVMKASLYTRYIEAHPRDDGQPRMAGLCYEDADLSPSN